MGEWDPKPEKKPSLGDCFFFFRRFLSLVLKVRFNINYILCRCLSCTSILNMQWWKESVCDQDVWRNYTMHNNVDERERKNNVTKFYVHMKYEVNANENRKQQKFRKKKHTKSTATATAPTTEQILYNSKL